MKRIIKICVVLISISFVSCGINSWSDDNDYNYYVAIHHQTLILNKSSQSVKIWRKIVPPDSTYVLQDRVIRMSGINPRDSINKDPYAFLEILDEPYCFVYGFSSKTQSYDSLLQNWSYNGIKTNSIFNEKNWDLQILKDEMYFERYGDGFPPKETRFQVAYPGYYGWFECAYTYTLTDEALNE